MLIYFERSAVACQTTFINSTYGNYYKNTCSMPSIYPECACQSRPSWRRRTAVPCRHHRWACSGLHSGWLTLLLGRLALPPACSHAPTCEPCSPMSHYKNQPMTLVRLGKVYVTRNYPSFCSLLRAKSVDVSKVVALRAILLWRCSDFIISSLIFVTAVMRHLVRMTSGA